MLSVLVAACAGSAPSQPSDSGTAADAGGVVDSGVQPTGDAGGPSTDSGIVASDAGGSMDSGTASDAGGPMDAGPGVDAGADVDAGPGVDAGADVDAGTVNPCSVSNGGCDVNATCSNLSGMASCQCKTGWTGNGAICAAVNGVNLSTSNQYRFAWPAVGDAALVATIDPNSFQTFSYVGDLHYLRKTGSTLSDIKLNPAASAGVTLNTIEVDLTGPTPSVVWLQNVDSNGVGQAYFADLSQATPVAKQLNATAFSINHAGAGNQIFLAGDVTMAGQSYGFLHWSDGNTTSAAIGGQGANALNAAIVYNADKSLAVAGVNLSNAAPGVSMGDLWAVNLKTGAATLLVTGVQVLVNGSPAFSLTTDGSSVAYLDMAQAVSVIKVSTGASQLITTKGNVPSLSGDGTLVAYTAGAAAYVSPVAAPAPVSVGVFSGAVAVAPIFSSDNSSILYFSKITEHSGVLGNAYVALTGASGAAFAAATNVGIVSANQNTFYTPIATAASACGSDYLLNASLFDQSGQTPDWFGVGQLTWVSAPTCAGGGAPKSTVLKTLNSLQHPVPITVGTHDMTVLNGGATAAFTGDYSISSVSGFSAEGNLYVVPFAELAKGPFTPVATNVQAESLRSSHTASRVVFSQNASESPIDSRMTFTGTLAVADAAGQVSRLAANAFTWIDPHLGIDGMPLTADGRVVVILAGPSGALSAGVWLIQLP